MISMGLHVVMLTSCFVGALDGRKQAEAATLRPFGVLPCSILRASLCVLIWGCVCWHVALLCCKSVPRACGLHTLTLRMRGYDRRCGT